MPDRESVRLTRRQRLGMAAQVATLAVAGWLIAVIVDATDGVGSRLPAPHLLPTVPGVTALRLAMVHDVLVARYPRHGTTWHEARLARRSAAITAHDAAGLAWDDSALSWFDDAAVSLDQLKRYAEAETLLCRKLSLLPPPPAPEADPSGALAALFDADPLQRARALARPLDPSWRQRYTTYANLATVIIHGSAGAARAGDATARERIRAGRAGLLRALAINPAAHFGRETWQLVVVDYLLAVLEQPELLVAYDCIGDRLDRPHDAAAMAVDPHVLRSIRVRYEPLAALLHVPAGELGIDERDRADVRSHAIARVGAEGAWSDDSRSLLVSPVPFDEPILAMLGMWMYGGGPNPHFALAIAGVMERIGQRHLAWEAYARAPTQSERFCGGCSDTGRAGRALPRAPARYPR